MTERSIKAEEKIARVTVKKLQSTWGHASASQVVRILVAAENVSNAVLKVAGDVVDQRGGRTPLSRGAGR